MQNRTAEIEQFKSEINLAEYACAVYGFVYDPKSSSRRSAVVRHANGDKLVITKRQNNHHVYFNVSGPDSGTIIDFIQSRKSASLGQIRKELRAWTVVDSGFPVTNKSIRLEAVQHDAIRVLKSWNQASVVQNDNEYLTGKRRIPSSTFMDPSFDEQIRVDQRRNLLFAHRNEDNEITGFEIKNTNFTGFSPGGVKSLFQSTPCGEEKIVVICETAIDLLSLATLVGTDLSQPNETRSLTRDEVVLLLHGGLYSSLFPAESAIATVEKVVQREQAQELADGCKLIVTCRTHRIESLALPPGHLRLNLKPFSPRESQTNLRLYFGEAKAKEAEEFHQLSDSNPRLQGYALTNFEKGLQYVLESLRPGKTLSDYFKNFISEAKLRNSEAAVVDKLCETIIRLPRPIPVDFLVAASGVTVDAIKDICSDLRISRNQLTLVLCNHCLFIALL